MTTLAEKPHAFPALYAVRANWRVYAIDGALLGIFMISACWFAALLEHPSSPAHLAIESGFARRTLTGVAMGMTALCLYYSPWGKRSGALLNPAMAISFLRMRRIMPIDAGGYILAQFISAAAGVAIVSVVLGMLVSHPSVNYAATVPGPRGLLVGWLGEFAITFVLMTIVMAVNKTP